MTRDTVPSICDSIMRLLMAIQRRGGILGIVQPRTFNGTGPTAHLLPGDLTDLEKSGPTAHLLTPQPKPTPSPQNTAPVAPNKDK